MKSLNDVIWDDLDLEEGGKKDVTKPEMQDICIIDSCLGPYCAIKKSYNTMYTCIK